MKRITVLFLLLTVGTYAGAQALDTVRIVSKARKFNPSKYIMIMFELMDTLDASGKNITMSRSYYFDKLNRKISSVRESDNPRKPTKGTQVRNAASSMTKLATEGLTDRLVELSAGYFTTEGSQQGTSLGTADPTQTVFFIGR